jgi:hypothetical protein
MRTHTLALVSKRPHHSNDGGNGWAGAARESFARVRVVLLCQSD